MATQYKKGDIVTVRYVVLDDTDRFGVTPVVRKRPDASVYHRFDDLDVIEHTKPIQVGDIVRRKPGEGVIREALFKVLGVDEALGKVWVIRNDTPIRHYNSCINEISNFEKV